MGWFLYDRDLRNERVNKTRITDINPCADINNITETILLVTDFILTS